MEFLCILEKQILATEAVGDGHWKWCSSLTWMVFASVWLADPDRRLVYRSLTWNGRYNLYGIQLVFQSHLNPGCSLSNDKAVCCGTPDRSAIIYSPFCE